jgi:hypothetical protein
MLPFTASAAVFIANLHTITVWTIILPSEHLSAHKNREVDASEVPQEKEKNTTRFTKAKLD